MPFATPAALDFDVTDLALQPLRTKNGVRCFMAVSDFRQESKFMNDVD